MTLPLAVGDNVEPRDVYKRLTELQYERNQTNFVRSTFRVQGDTLDIFPAHYEDRAWRISFFGDEIDDIYEFDSLTGKKTTSLQKVTVYPANHYVTPRPAISQAITGIRKELAETVENFKNNNKLLEAQRIEQHTRFDLEMLETTGHCKGIENYSRYLTGRKPGEPPPTLFEYLPPNALIFIDESHISVPQIGGMFRGDYNRKKTLSEYGFRLPSCVDNRPPTGLTDPVCVVRPVENQVDDLMEECRKVIAKKERVLVTTLTKKMAEDLTEYLNENGIKVRYLHSDIDTLERIEIIRDLRLGVFDVLVGINLLREGLDIPECSLVAILDADKEGFLRSTRSLIQTIGRAARNAEGKVILYADRMTGSIEAALEETNRRREKQIKYNTEHGITPKTIKKSIASSLKEMTEGDFIKDDSKEVEDLKNIDKKLKEYNRKMKEAAQNLEFEEAMVYRDKIKEHELLAMKNL